MTSGLQIYLVDDQPAVLKALTRCRREVKGMLTIQDVVSRIDDGRLGVEEAWAMMPFSESQSVVWTEEMAQAFERIAAIFREAPPASGPCLGGTGPRDARAQ